MEAIHAVPDALADEGRTVRFKERIRDRFSHWQVLPITTLNIITFDIEAVRLMAELAL